MAFGLLFVGLALLLVAAYGLLTTPGNGHGPARRDWRAHRLPTDGACAPSGPIDDYQYGHRFARGTAPPPVAMRGTTSPSIAPAPAVPLRSRLRALTPPVVDTRWDLSDRDTQS